MENVIEPMIALHHADIKRPVKADIAAGERADFLDKPLSSLRQVALPPVNELLLGDDKSNVQPISKEDLTVAVEQVTSFLRLTDTDLVLRMDDESGGKPVISIYDGDDGSLLRQYPSEEMLAVARKITEQMQEFRDALIHGGTMPTIQGVFADTVV